ncbi:glycine-rich RNA-binding protein GRP1A-like [Ipomoea triloba]|uniref:glycine-rich RNA-binding protein GRP1A-like n=1 Tax=Ipomoea triloba TaxID=35885 RepID=UPI00125D31D1|nr:glycine-rich RNA-binding protein GRP1A-like [Ipomoea triloba]
MQKLQKQLPKLGLFPVFDGNEYETWRHMMKALLKSHDLWDLVEKGYKAKAFKKDGKKKDALAMMIILLGVDKSVRRCTLNANNSKEAWDAIQNKYQVHVEGEEGDEGSADHRSQSGQGSNGGGGGRARGTGVGGRAGGGLSSHGHAHRGGGNGGDEGDLLHLHYYYNI